METRANFLLVSLFVGAMLLGAVQFVFFIVSPGLTSRRVTYELVIAGPAGGLTRGSSVYFNGLSVGEVSQVTLSSEEPGHVIARFDVDKSTPVRTNTRARVKRTSLTGAAEIMLDGAAASAGDIPILAGQLYPRLFAEDPAATDPLIDVQLLPARLAHTLEKAQKTIAGAPTALSAIKWNIDGVFETLDMKPGDGTTRAFDFKSANQSLSLLTSRLDRMIAAADSAGKSRMLNELEATSAKLKTLSSSDLERLEKLASDARKKVEALDNMVRALELGPPAVGAAPAASPATTKGPGVGER
jgi:phospholipid/cholesterol/gamma-HCH transport system substrate-binding protein